MITVCISNKLLYEQMGNIVFQGLKEIALTPNSAHCGGSLGDSFMTLPSIISRSPSRVSACGT